jgi:hypothetical protein
VRSDLSYELRRECQCRSCRNPIPDFAPLHQRYCQALCRANAWSRANREFSSAITVADFENVRETIKQFSARLNRVVVRYALVGRHPIGKVDRQIGDPTFPPKDRKTKRMPDETGRTRFSSAPYYSFSPWFEGPRVPVVGNYRVNVWFEGNARPTETNLIVDVRKSFPAVHFYDEKTGQRYTLKGEVIPPKAPKPPKPPTERKKRKPAAAIGPQPEREASAERVAAMVPATVAQRAPDAELVAQVKKLEDERLRLTNERTDLLATINKERALRQESEQKLLRATSMPKPPAKDDSVSRLLAAQNRAHGDELKKLGESLSELRGRVTELEKGNASLTKERDDLTTERDALKALVVEQKLGHATLARQLITLENRATEAARERTELTAKLSEVEQPRDELIAKPDQAESAATAVPAATADTATADAGAASTPPTGPTGIVIHRLALGGNLPPASSPKTGPPSLGILGQNHRPPIRGSANKKHKRR